jgi:hypothetical protein
VENAVDEVINKISLRRLIDGGAAILMESIKNHHKAIIGFRMRNPLVKGRDRV